jgi:hypothetical protein
MQGRTVVVRGGRAETADDREATFAANRPDPVLSTNPLLDRSRESARSRIVNTASTVRGAARHGLAAVPER